MRHRNFQLFFSGQLISLIGTWMQNIAQAWLVYRLTGSSLLLGTVGFASQFPVFLFSPIGGVAADRYNRHRIVIATQTASMVLAFILAALTLTHRVTVADIIALAALLGIVNAFDVPARQAFIVEMVGKEDLMNAIALNSSMFNGARIVGPAVAGLIVAAIGEGWCFFANAVSYIAVIGGLLLMQLPAWTRRVADSSPLQHIVEGMRFARRTRPVAALLLLIGVLSLVAMPYTVLMPVFADAIFHSGANGLGLLMGATGVGALLGALTLAARKGLSGLGTWVAISAAGFAVTLILFSLIRNFWLAFAILVPSGFFMMVQSTSSNTLIQAMVPDHLRGRVMSLYVMMFLGLAPFGSLFAGAIAERIGAPWTVIIGALVCVIGAALFAARLPSLRVEARRLIISQGMAAGDPPQELATTIPVPEPLED